MRRLSSRLMRSLISWPRNMRDHMKDPEAGSSRQGALPPRPYPSPMSFTEETDIPGQAAGPAPASDPAGEPDPLLADLTPPQREAVLCTEGPLLVLAAAGSGKTRVITRRIAHLVRMGVPPWSILALTFTNKAAAEMRHRVGVILGGEPAIGPDGEELPPTPPRGLTVTTFHSLCARLLRRYADIAGIPGLKHDFGIYPSADQLALMKRVIAEQN